MNRTPTLQILCVVACVCTTLAGSTPAAQSVSDARPGDVQLLRASDLKQRSAGVLLTTPTHLFKLVRVTGPMQAESHEGTTDVLFVESGDGGIQVGGEIEGAAPLPGMPGELRGKVLTGGRRYELKPGAMINIPPLTPYMLQRGSADLTLIQLRVNVMMHPWPIVQTQQSTLPVTPSRPRVTSSTAVGQGNVVFWSAETMHGAHKALAAKAAAGESVSDPRDLVEIPITPTHAFNFMHRVLGPNGRLPGVEFHEGTTDIYFVIDGSATLMTGGTVEGFKPIENRPGEFNGPRIDKGTPYKLQAGDVFNMPPSINHQSIPDAGGYTYMLIKVNTGHYPWSLAER